MKIQVLGSGCANCKNLYELTKTAVKELNLQAEVEYITDITVMVEMGIIQSPAIAIDGIPVMFGMANLDKIKAAILSKSPVIEKKSCCSCGGKC